MKLHILGGRRTGLGAGLALAAAMLAFALAPAASQAAFTLAPCHGSATAGRGATFPALLHNSGYWGAGFDSSAGCGSTSGAPSHPTYNSSTIDSVGTTAHSSTNGSGGGVGACGGGAGGWPVGHRDATVRFCATDDPVTPTQLTNMDTGQDASQPGSAAVPGLMHQLPWVAGAMTVSVHVPEGCVLPKPTGSTASGSQVTGWTGDPSGDGAATATTRPYISDALLEKAFAGDPSVQYWGQLVPGLTGTPQNAASGDAQDTGLSCNGTTSGTGIPIIRIVRSDNSGSSFNFKGFLGLVNGGIGTDATNGWTGTVSNTGGTPLGSSGTANTAWPAAGSFTSKFDAGATGHQTDANNICEWNTSTFAGANTDVQNDHICGGHNTGAGNVALGVLATSGSIGYVDVATARLTKLTGVPAKQQDLQDYQTTPNLSSPSGVTATPSTTGGSLAAGTYYYEVTAINGNGETLPSSEVSATTTGTTGSVALSWTAVPGATSYKVYRDTTSGNETTGTTELVNSTTTASFNDTGTATTAGHAPTSAPAFVVRDDTFWIPLQNNPDQTSGNSWVEPTKDPTNHQASGSGSVGTQGANCSNLPNLKNVPPPANSPNGDATLGDWSKTSAVGGSGYPVCLLSYGLIWDDNSKVYGTGAGEEAQARTVLDYANFIAGSYGSALVGTDFSAAPSSIQNIVKTGTPDGTGQGGLLAVGWNKSAGATTTTSTTQSQVQTTQPVTTTSTHTVVVLPPPSSVFTLSGVKVKSYDILGSLKLPNPGKLTVTATFKYKSGKKTKTATFASLKANVKAGKASLTLRPGSTAKKLINEHQNLKVSLKVVFQATGGKAYTKTTNVTVKGKPKPKPKPKKKAKHKK
jgi:hypothetical protein